MTILIVFFWLFSFHFFVCLKKLLFLRVIFNLILQCFHITAWELTSATTHMWVTKLLSLKWSSAPFILVSPILLPIKSLNHQLISNMQSCCWDCKGFSNYRRRKSQGKALISDLDKNNGENIKASPAIAEYLLMFPQHYTSIFTEESNWTPLSWTKCLFYWVLEGQPIIKQHFSFTSMEYLHVESFGGRALFLYKECTLWFVNDFSSNLLSAFKPIF